MDKISKIFDKKGISIIDLLNFLFLRKPPSRIIGKIKIYGPIIPSSSKYYSLQGTTPDKVINKIEWAIDNKIKVLIIEINSPGGAVVACKEIADFIKDARIKTVAWIRDYAVSGAYWIASACNIIVADALSSVGSIGVIMPHLEFSGLMEKYGVTYEDFKAGKFKDMVIPFRKSTSEEKKIINQHLSEVHNLFIKSVANYRNIPVNKIKQYCDGSIYHGLRAKEIGLIDIIGGKKEVIAECEKLAHFKSRKIFDIEDIREELIPLISSLFY